MKKHILIIVILGSKLFFAGPEGEDETFEAQSGQDQREEQELDEKIEAAKERAKRLEPKKKPIFFRAKGASSNVSVPEGYERLSEGQRQRLARSRRSEFISETNRANDDQARIRAEHQVRVDGGYQRSPKKVGFAMVEFDPNNVETWDSVNIRRVKPSIIAQLGVDQVEQLFNTLDFLSNLKPEQLRVIDPSIFLNTRFPKEVILKILNEPSLLDKFSPEQIVAMKSRVSLESLTTAQVREINPRVLSDLLYYQLPEPLDESFVNKLSDEQIEKLYADHLAWGFHNLRTKFKNNLTPDALHLFQSKYDELLAYKARMEERVF